MNRVKILIRNIVIILLLILVSCYINGVYISKENCILDSLRALYGTEREFVTEIDLTKASFTLMFDSDKKTVSMIGVEKHGPFYTAGNCSVGDKIDEDAPFDVFGYYSLNSGPIYYVYRNDKNIDRVEVELENGTSFVLDEWIKDFAVMHIEALQWSNGLYRAYDQEGNFMYEITY